MARTLGTGSLRATAPRHLLAHSVVGRWRPRLVCGLTRLRPASLAGIRAALAVWVQGECGRVLTGAACPDVSPALRTVLSSWSSAQRLTADALLFVDNPGTIVTYGGTGAKA